MPDPAHHALRLRHDDDGSEERMVWRITTIIEATEEEANVAQEAIGRALCPDPGHSGYCPVPWTTLAARFDDLDPQERSTWQASFDEDRKRAGE